MRLAIDPGDLHVGLAWGSSEVEYCEEVNAEDAVDWIREFVGVWGGVLSEVVVEAFVLYPGQDQRKSWNPMLTSEMIGKIKLICEDNGIPWVEQPASIQKPTRAQMRGRGIAPKARGPHQHSAEFHWYYRELGPRKDEDTR